PVCFLDVVLAQISEFQAREKEMRSKVMAAMLYPCVLLFLALSVLTFLMIFFIPRFQLIFADFHANLPLLTQVIVKTSDVLRSYGLYVGLALGIGVFLVRNWFVSPAGRRMWEGWILRFPAVGPLVAQY